MTNFLNAPLENGFEVELEGSISSTAVSMTLSRAPSFTLPAGQSIYAVIDPKNNFREVVKITAIVGAVCTIVRAQPYYKGETGVAYAHSGGATVIITDTFQIFDEIATAVNSKIDKNTGELQVYATTAARDVAITSPANGMQVYITDIGKYTDYTAGSWVTRESGGTFANASETVAGKVEIATAAQLAAGTGTGETGAPLVVSPNNAAIVATSAGAADAGKLVKLNASGQVDTTMISGGFSAIANRDNSYTPAHLTSGVNVFSTHNLWTGTTDGSFQITIDGTPRSITGLNFSAVTSMANVASIIQAGIRAVTSGLETCTWTGTTLVVSSGLTTSSSAITVASAGVGGTDISGAGGAAYMDCDTGNGVVTATAVNVTGDAGKIVALDTDGYINNNLSKLPVPVIRTYTITNPVLGAANTQFDITNPSGTTMRVTYDGTGTDPLISATTVPVGTILDIYALNFNVGNKGRFTVTASDTNYFEVTNAGVVAETNKTIGKGLIAINSKPLGNWTKPAGLGYVVVETVGGGGGGGGTSSNDSAGGGGGGGGYSRRTITATALGATEAVTVGGGGVGYGSGTAGGTSTFGVLVQASGGNGGAEGTSGAALGGDGGIGSNGDINTTGDDGGTGAIDSTFFTTTGSGGGSALGGSAKGAQYSSTGGGNGSGGNIYGGGGAGGGNADSNDDRFGGIGATGIVVVTEYY